ncbi:CotH kinase family protein, partial [Bacteroidota bacterium]
FKLSFNTFIQGREFYGVEKLNLNGEHNDPSIIRSKLCWDLFNELGVISSRASHAAVYINGDYYGLYISVEHIDEEFVRKNYSDRNGNLWKCLYPADLVYLGDDPDLYKATANGRRKYDLKTNVEENNYSQLARLIDIINNTPNEYFTDSLEAIINIKDVLMYFAVNVSVGGWDDYWFLKNNYYLYYSPSEDIFHFIPYDYDNTFGIDWFSIDWSTVNPYTFAKIDNDPRPLIEKIIQIPQYHNLFTHFIQFINSNVHNWSLMAYDIYSIKNLIVNFAEDDIYRIMDYGFSIDDFHNSYFSDSYSKVHVKNSIEEFMLNRNNSLSNQLYYFDVPPIVYNIDYSSPSPKLQETLYINASIFGSNEISTAKIKLHEVSSGNSIYFPMNYNPDSETKIIEEFDRWSGEVSSLSNSGQYMLTIEVTDTKNNEVSFPRGKSIYIDFVEETSTGIIINELMARNNSTISDEFDEFDDWIELYNNSQNIINLRNHFLSDDPDSLSRWRFPDQDFIINPYEYLIVWCDNDDEQGDLHTNFKLDGDGEFIALIHSDGTTILDSISFTEQRFDISFGRDVGNNTVWGFMSPTPGAANSVVSVREDYVVTEFYISAFPNPFNPSTTINYSVPEFSSVNLEIYDLLGQLVWNSKTISKSPGKYEFIWEGINSSGEKLSSGVYILRVNVQNSSKSLKLVLTK